MEVRPEPAWGLESCRAPLCMGSSAWNSNACGQEVALALGPLGLQHGESICWEQRSPHLSGLLREGSGELRWSLSLFTGTGNWCS